MEACGCGSNYEGPQECDFDSMSRIKRRKENSLYI